MLLPRNYYVTMSQSPVFTITLITLLASSCGNTKGDDENGFRDLFAVPASLDLNDASRAQAVLRRIPIGSNETQIHDFFSRAAEADRNLIDLFPVDSSGTIVSRIGFDPKTAGIVHTSYVVQFWVGTDRLLDSVVVRKVLTGP